MGQQHQSPPDQSPRWQRRAAHPLPSLLDRQHLQTLSKSCPLDSSRRKRKQLRRETPWRLRRKPRRRRLPKRRKKRDWRKRKRRRKINWRKRERRRWRKGRRRLRGKLKNWKKRRRRS